MPYLGPERRLRLVPCAAPKERTARGSRSEAIHEISPSRCLLTARVELRFWVLLAAALGLFAYSVHAAATCNPPTLCVQEYWSRPWTASYLEGHTRRAFVGTLADLFSSSGRVSILVVNGVSAVILLLVALAGVKLLRPAGGKKSRLLVMAFLLGPTVMMLFETLGDVLHWALLLFLLVCMLPKRAFKLGLWLLLPLSLLVHEASLFLFWPATLALLFRERTPRTRAIAIATGLVLGLAVQVALPYASPEATRLHLSTPSGELLTFDRVAPPSLSATLRSQVQFYFERPVATLRLLYQCVSFALWPTLFGLVYAQVTRRLSLLKNFLALLVLSIPLFLLAHDWARFAIVLLFVAIALEAQDFELAEGARSPRSARLHAWLEGVVLRISPSFPRIFPVLFIADSTYRVWGMPPAGLALMVAAFCLFWAPSRSASSASASPSS